MTDSKPPEQRGALWEKTWFETRMEKTWFQALLFAGALALYLLFGLVLWWVLDQYINPQESTEKKDLIQALGLIMAGVAGAIGIYFTWRGQRLTRRAQEENQRNTQEELRNTQEELSLTREGQITDRFTRAIDQLGATDDNGNKRLEIRLGGIYTLERIASDSPARDYSTVMEVLAAYVRDNAPWLPESSQPPQDGSVLDIASNEGADEQDAESAPHSPPTDIQAILDVFKRREENRVPEKHRVRLDLRRTDLRGADLRGAHLDGADFRRANLEGAILFGAHLQGAYLRGANLAGAYLNEAHLQEAFLLGANLEKAGLDSAHLEGAALSVAHLERALLNDAHLEGADLFGAYLQGATLRGATGLSQRQIDMANGDETTKLPEGLRRPERWGRNADEQTNGDE